MSTLEDWWPTAAEWLSRTTIFVGALIGVLGLLRALAEVSRKSRLRRIVERNLRIYEAMPSQPLRSEFARLLEEQASELIEMERTPFYRRRRVRVFMTLTFVGLAVAGLLYSHEGADTSSTPIRGISLAVLSILVIHFLVRGISTFLSKRHELPHNIIRWMDEIAEDGLLRILAWRLRYVRRSSAFERSERARQRAESSAARKRDGPETS
jgi:hypothetical protein